MASTQDRDATALPLALAMTATLTVIMAVATPYHHAPPSWWPKDRIQIVTVFVCEPKDEGRVAQGSLIPKPVKTSSFVAADITPFAQARDSQSKRKKK